MSRLHKWSAHYSLLHAQKNDARLTLTGTLTSAVGLTGHLILQILPSNFAGVQRRRLTVRPVQRKGAAIPQCPPPSCVLGEYGGDAYYIGQARQDLVGTTRHFVPPFFTFDITPIAPPSTLGLLEGGRSTRY